MTTVSRRALCRCAAVLLAVVLSGWLAVVGVEIQRADGAESHDRAGLVAALPTLILDPDKGSPGTPFDVNASGYSACDDNTEFWSYDVIWDKRESLLDRPEESSSYDFQWDVQVPPQARAGNHHVAVVCGSVDENNNVVAAESADALFTVPSSPTLQLSPNTGKSGTYFNVRGNGYSNCNFDCGGDNVQSLRVEVIWEDTGEVLATSVMSDDGKFSAVDVPVPQTATPGNHQVIGRFGTESAKATFAVPPPLTLILSPNEGSLGTPTSFTVRGSGYSNSRCFESEFPSAEVSWDRTEKLTVAPMSSEGTFEANVSVPQGKATPGGHLVSGRCGDENPTAIFTIPSSPTLTLIPAEGRPGTRFTVEGNGYSHCNYDCAEEGRLSRVEVIWGDTGEVIATASMSDDGKFSAVDVPTPQTATPGNHQVVARFGAESAEATFVVLPSPTLRSPTLALYPDEGRPGSLFEVRGHGYSSCSLGGCPAVEVFWGLSSERIGTGVTGSDGTFSVNVNVPQAAAPGNHQVVARFGAESAAATFVVVPSPVLRLYPDEGRFGARFKVEGRGYGRCFGTCSYVSQGSRVEVLWGTGNEVLATTEMGSDGAFSVDVNVPPTATPGEHQVTGRFGAESASAFFTVEPPPVDPSVLDLTLTPNEGHPDDSFKIEGAGYNKCSDRGDRVVNIYDRNVPDSNGFRLALARNVSISEQGTFSVIVQMPPTAAVGRHEINVQCFGGREYASDFFTVTGPPGSTPGPPGSTPETPLPEFPLPPSDVLGEGSGSPERAYLATKVPSPIEVFDDPTQLLLSLLLVGLLVLVVAFPAELFNSTFENNRDEINSWFSWAIPRLRRLRLNLPSWIHLDILGLVAAFALLMAVVRDVGLNYATLAQAVVFIIAVPLVVVALEMPRGWYYRRKNIANNTQTYLSSQTGRRAPQWHVLPAALIVAGFLALVSRLADFEPPYVYGLIAVYIGADLALKNRDADADKGRGTLIGVLCLIALSIIAWFSWIPVDRIIDSGQREFEWLVLDALLATVFLLGLETAVFGMIPLTFLKGKDIFQWRPWVWVAAFALIACVFINVALVAESESLTRTLADPGKIIKAIALFLAFGIFSVLFWWYFHPSFRPVRRWWSRLVHRWLSRLVPQ